MLTPGAGEDFLGNQVVGVLNAGGVPPEDGKIVADCLLMANLSGVDSHGVVRLAHYLRRLENELHAATAQIGVAEASRFPYLSIGLTSFFGLISPELSRLFDPADRYQQRAARGIAGHRGPGERVARRQTVVMVVGGGGGWLGDGGGW